MVPYCDPECDCTVETVFFGEISDGVLEGTYESYLGGRAVLRVPASGGPCEPVARERPQAKAS